MTETLSEAPVASQPRRVARAITVGAVVCVAAVGVVGYRWLTDDRLFGPSAGQQAFALTLGHTYYSGLGGEYSGQPPDTVRRLDVREVNVTTSINTADATIAVVRCVEGAAGPGLTAGGNAVDHLGDACITSTPFVAGPVDFGQHAGATGFVVAITPHHAGTVEIDGASISYRDGLRHGKQRIGPSLVVTVQ